VSGAKTAARTPQGALRTLAWISGLYDLALGVAMLLFAPAMARAFGAPPPVPVVNAQLNGVFTLTLGIGYFWAAAAPTERRGYFWLAGVLAKGLGTALFLFDHFARGSPRAFLLFALTDGALALATLALLLRRPAGLSIPSPARADGTPPR
jgi:hypothetical protein